MFVKLVGPLMKSGRDSMWVLPGRTPTNLTKIRQILKELGLHYAEYSLWYNTKQMGQYGYWKRKRGLANSKSVETAFSCYFSKPPKTMPKERKYVDAGSSLFHAGMRSVPALAPKWHAFVCAKVREKNIKSMAGRPSIEDEEELENEKRLKQIEEEGLDQPGHENEPNEPQEAEAATQAAAIQHVKKRKLYKVTSGSEVHWFPFDNSMELMKELLWESGSPRWVIHGTPASGAGLLGCIEMGASVVAICFDDHHREHLQKYLLERALELMVSGETPVFKAADIEAQLLELNPSLALNPDEKQKAKEEIAAQEEEARAKAAKAKAKHTLPGRKPRKAKAEAEEAKAAKAKAEEAESSAQHTLPRAKTRAKEKQRESPPCQTHLLILLRKQSPRRSAAAIPMKNLKKKERRIPPVVNHRCPRRGRIRGRRTNECRSISSLAQF